MNHLLFFPFHNRLIQFEYQGIFYKGVVLDIIPNGRKLLDTHYIFIDYSNLEFWRNSEKILRIKKQKIIDIAKITNVELVT